MVKKPLVAKAGERVRRLRAQRGPEQDVELPRRRHDLRPRLDGGQSRQPVPGHADRAARLVQQRDRGIHDPGGRLVHHGRSSLRQRLAGRDRAHLDGRQAARGRISSTTTCPRRRRRPTPTPSQGKLAFESKCLACHSIGAGREARPRPGRRHEAAERRVADALAEVAGEDAGDRSRRQGHAEGVQQPSDAESEPLGRRDPASTSSTSTGSTPSPRAR